MKQEEKELILKDLCARLPYGVKVLDDMGRTYELPIGNTYLIDLFYGNGDYIEVPIRPYLRPMSSMTEDEKRKYSKCMWAYQDVDFCNEHHLDYRGLIDKELALEAPEGMYDVNKE